jgi:hypothetical protein
MSNKQENIFKYIPNQASVSSINTNININKKHPINKTAFNVQGLHSAESCALNAGIYAANTAYSENEMIRDGKTITAKDGLSFTIYNNNILIQDGISTNFSNFINALPGVNAVNNYTHINWVGYFYVTTLDPCTFSGRNISMWIGDYALRLYNNSNTNLSKTTTSYTYYPQKINTFIPIRLEYKNDGNDFTFSCKQNLLKPTFSFVTLYKGCDVYYTNQVLYSIVKNRNTPSNLRDKNNYFDCTIYGRKKDGTIVLNQNNIVSNAKKPSTNNTIPTQLYQSPAVPYTHNKDDRITLNIAKANPKMGKTYKQQVDGSLKTIPENDPMFNYGISKHVTYNPIQQTFPINYTGRSDITLQNCSTNCSNNSSCKGFYFGENIGKGSACNQISNTNITYLPQQPNQKTLSKSTLYVKNPAVDNTNIDVSFNIIKYVEPFVEGNEPIPKFGQGVVATTYQSSTKGNAIVTQDPIVNKEQIAALKKIGTSAISQTPNQNPLLLKYLLHSIKNNNNATTPEFKNEISNSPSVIALNNGLTVTQSGYRNNVQLPSFSKIDKYILGKPISLSINFKPQIVTKKAHQIWRIFDFSGKDTFFQLYIICDKGKVNTLYCKSKVEGAPQEQDIAIDLQNMCSMNSWNNITVVFHPSTLKLFLNKKELQIENRPIFLPDFSDFTNNKIGSNIIAKEGFQDAVNVKVWEKNRLVGVSQAKAAIKQARIKDVNNHYARLRKILIQRQRKIRNEARRRHRSLNMPKINMPKIKLPKININGYIEEANDFTRKIRDLLKNVAKKAINEINMVIKAIANFFKNLFRGLKRPKPPHYNDSVLFYDFRLYNVDISVPDNKGKSIMSTISITPGLENFSNININQDMQTFSFDSPSYSIIEGATNITDTVPTEMGPNAKANITQANTSLLNYSSYLNNITSKQNDLSQNITNYNNTRARVYNTPAISNGTTGVVYSFDSNGNIIPNTMDSTGKIVAGKNSTTRDVIKNDLDTLIVQQNTVYITGTIACATLLIAAIMIGSK